MNIAKYPLWGPEHFDFMIAHLGKDMSALEVARYFGVSPSKVHDAAEVAGIPWVESRCTAIHSPYAPVVAMNVRKATWRDAYEPLSWAQFRVLYPDRQDDEPAQRS